MRESARRLILSARFMPGTYRCALCIKALLRANPCNDGKEIVMITSGIQSFALSHGEQYKHGRTSLRDLSGKLPFVANGCTMLLCVEGRAVVTTNTRKRTFRKGDLLVLFSDTLFAPLCVSPSFTAEYISLSLELTGEIFYKMTSPAFGTDCMNIRSADFRKHNTHWQTECSSR